MCGDPKYQFHLRSICHPTRMSQGGICSVAAKAAHRQNKESGGSAVLHLSVARLSKSLSHGKMVLLVCRGGGIECPGMDMGIKKSRNKYNK